MALIDSIRSVITSSVESLYSDGLIYCQEITQDEGGDSTIVYAEYEAKIQVDSVTEAMRQSGASEQDRAIFVLQQRTSAPFDSDSETLLLNGPHAGKRFSVSRWNSDPAAVYWLGVGTNAGAQA